MGDLRDHLTDKRDNLSEKRDPLHEREERKQRDRDRRYHHRNRSPVRIYLDQFYEVSSIGECDMGNCKTLRKIASEKETTVSSKENPTTPSKDKSTNSSDKENKEVIKESFNRDDTDEDMHIKEAVIDETIAEEFPPNKKGISAKSLLQKQSHMDSQDWSVFLPEELVLILFKFLKPGDILSTSQTCRLWRKLGENDKLWEQICKEAGLSFSLTVANLSALERRNKNSSINFSAWKENFLKPYKIAKKFRQEYPQVLNVEMSNHVNQMKVFNDMIVVSYKNTHTNNLYVFCALSGRITLELVGHTSNVEVIQIDKHLIISGSHDEVKVWNVDTGVCLRTLHMIRVASLQIHGAIVVTGSFDGTVRVWDVFAKMCLRTMREHVPGNVIHLQFDGRLVVSGIEWPEYPINVWDPQTGKCLRTLDQNHFNYFRLHGCHLLVMLPGGSIKVWDVDTGVCLHTLEGIDAEYMALMGDRLVSRSGNGANIWGLSTGAYLYSLAGLREHNRSINGIQVNEKFVVTSSWDGKVMLSDVKTGDFIRYLFVMEPDETVVKMEMKDAKIVFFIHHWRREVQTKLLVLNFDTNETDSLQNETDSLQNLMRILSKYRN